MRKCLEATLHKHVSSKDEGLKLISAIKPICLIFIFFYKKYGLDCCLLHKVAFLKLNFFTILWISDEIIVHNEQTENFLVEPFSVNNIPEDQHFILNIWLLLLQL